MTKKKSKTPAVPVERPPRRYRPRQKPTTNVAVDMELGEYIREEADLAGLTVLETANTMIREFRDSGRHVLGSVVRVAVDKKPKPRA